MKKIFFIAVVVASIPLLQYHGISFAAEVKKVCVDKITNDGKPVMGKDGKPEQVCKEVKVHEKLDGHKVPDKK